MMIMIMNDEDDYDDIADDDYHNNNVVGWLSNKLMNIQGLGWGSRRWGQVTCATTDPLQQDRWRSSSTLWVMGRPLCEVQYDFELDQFATHEAEHFRTFPEFSRQRKESQDVRLLLGPTAPRQYPECRQESAQCQAHTSSSTGQHKPHTEDWTWSKAPTASKATPQDRRDSREHKGATSAQYQSELIVQQKLHRASKDVSSRQHHGNAMSRRNTEALGG